MKDPCPDSDIKQMVKDGCDGTDHGDGLKQVYGKAKGSGAAQYYRASRMYNGGSVDPSGDLGKGCCTKCYASDIANRLTGWVMANHGCDLDGETGWSPMGHVDGSASSDTADANAATSDATTAAADTGKSTQWDGDDGMWHGNDGSWDNGQWSGSKAAGSSASSWSAGGASGAAAGGAGGAAGAAGAAAPAAAPAAGSASQW